MLCISSGPWSLWIELKTWIDRGQMCVCVFVMHPRDQDQVKLKNQNSKKSLLLIRHRVMERLFSSEDRREDTELFSDQFLTLSGRARSHRRR